MSKYDNFVGMVGVAFGLVGLGYAFGTYSKMAKISDTLEHSIDELASNAVVDIPDSMIERAVEKAVAYEVKQAVTKATDRILVDVKKDIHKQISDAVESEYSSIKDAVLEELVTEAANIDAARIRADVERAAKDQVLKKFDTNLDSIADDFKEKLNDYLEDCKGNIAIVNKVYKSFAEAVAPSGNRETVLRIG